MTPHDGSSKLGSWTSKLYKTIRPAPHPLMVEFSNSLSRFRHSPGQIWRHALSSSVYRDLKESPGGFGAGVVSSSERRSGESKSRSSSRGPPIAAVRAYTWRRFVRVEHFGLSGLLFYEIGLPSTRLGVVESMERGDDDIEKLLTLESVFGDPNDPADPGMDVDDLLDAVHAKLVYFPAYACTSFLMGQAVLASFRDRPMLQPWPDREGFSVLSPEISDDVFSTSCPGPVSLVPAKALLSTQEDAAEFDGECSSLSSCSSGSGDVGIADVFSLDQNDPHVSLCVRSSNLSQPIRPPTPKLSDHESDEKEDEDANTTSSTIDSMGPLTPPRSRPVELDARLFLSSGMMCKPAPPPVFVSVGTFCLSVYDDLASFLDLSASELEDDSFGWADMNGESDDDL
ncbi:hypothetical protein GALMADRAFT_132717 [Galerina marginata CBS 339.88]|uniref:Uncharacterized protein n=1 Tax=Galerina marginata (strain CBS 339.88) TaxID=685588 RepID=A0A067U1G9_GALM3|nr:hypothetical protein GALMADRAFT_132717 [Galerina marginata CBS 339.88]